MAHVKYGNLPLDARLIIARHTAEKEANARGRDLFHVTFACHVDMSKKRSILLGDRERRVDLRHSLSACAYEIRLHEW